MRVCFVNMPIEYYSPTSGGAIATIIAQTGRALIAAGHDVTVLTPTDGGPVYDVGEVVPVAAKRRADLSFCRRRLSGLRRRFGRWDWPYFEHYLRSVERRLRDREPPDVVVLFNDLYSSPRVRRAVPSANIAVWLQNEWRSHPDNVAATASATDVFLCCSGYVRDWTARTHGIPPGRFAVVPSGVDLELFHPRPDPTVAATPVRVLFVGRIDRNKGPDLAADAVFALRRQGLAVTLTVVGGLWFYVQSDPMADPFFRELQGKMALAEATYLGHVTRDQLPAVVREHDVVCVLSRSNEPFGLVTLEAMASGCAVVASDRGGLPEACGGAALLVDPDDALAILSRLKQLVTRPDVLAGRKRKSLARAATADWAVTARALVQAVGADGAADRRGPPEGFTAQRRQLPPTAES